MLSVQVEKNLGSFSVNARFDSEGGVTALFGPSGAGKTSIINMIAGLMTRSTIWCCSTAPPESI